jgi:hypothetical protein
MRPATRLLAPVALTLSLLLAACSGSGPSPSDGGIIHPSGDQLVLRFEYRGGFVPPEFVFTSFPAFTLLGDGRVIVPGAQIEIFPGPALPAVQVRQLTEAGIQTVLNTVAASGQFAASVEWRAAQNFVADAPDTVFTLNAEGRTTTTISVYGLGTFLPDDAPANVPAAELAAHRALNHLVEQLTTLEAWLPPAAWVQPAWQPYVPDALRLLVRNADADPPDESGIEAQELPWPAGDDAATFGAPVSFGDFRCGVVTGDEADAWYEALASANQLTIWTSGDHRYAVSVRVLLPDEAEECPADG